MDDLLKQKRTLDSGNANSRPHGGQNAGREAVVIAMSVWY